ncbi:hypothetical protein EBR44_15095, partial [bacterium]|nr:hypothetical protein [bacterium]
MKRSLVNRMVAAALVTAPMLLGAQGAKNANGVDAFDRTKVPALGKTPLLKLPMVEMGALANGVGIQL